MSYTGPERRHRSRFRTRVFMNIAVLSLATSMAAAWVYYWRQLGFVERDLGRRAHTLLGNLATQAELGAYASDAALCDLALRRTFSEDDVVLAAVYDRHGNEIAHVAKSALIVPPPDPRIVARMLANANARSERSLRRNFNDLYEPIVTVSRDTVQAMFDGRGSSNTRWLAWPVSASPSRRRASSSMK